MKRLTTLFSPQMLGRCVLLLLLCLGVAAQAQTYDAVVAQDGSGAFRTVQAAINAAPTGRTAVYTIFIKSGKYREKVNVPSNKPFLQLIGQSVANTVISWDDYSGKPMPGGGTYGTNNSGTVTVSANDFSALNLTIENTTGDAPQALAISAGGDRVAFKNCRFLGGQDTVLTNGPGRQYYKDCYIDGTVDFIFGGSQALFEGCIIYPKTRRDGGSGGYITAANTPAGQAYGYVFKKCYIPANRGLTVYTLGRPWQNDAGSTTANRANNKVVWLNAVMGPNVINPAGWSTWDSGTNTSVITYAEYKSRDVNGALVNVSQRVPWSIQLTDADTATYTRPAMFGTWDPCAVYTNFCPSVARSIAVANFMAVKGTPTAPSNLTWNISWPIAGVQYQVMRSTTRRGTYAPLYTTTSANAIDVNFATTDAIPAPGVSYYYYVQASKTGLATHITDTLQISSTPTIFTTGTLQAFLQGGGVPSAAQSVLVSAENLTAGVTITPPAGFQVSANGGSTWFGPATPLVLTQSSTGAVASTSLSVRLNASAPGTSAGNLTLTSAGAATVSLPVSGQTQTAPLPQSVNLQWWPMTRNNQDSIAVRANGVAASTTTLRKMVVSSGSAASTFAPYSSRGQALAPIAEGSWLTSGGGNGSNLNRTYYEQFTVAPSGNTPVRVDSVQLNYFVNGSTSNTKLAVVSSRSNFVSDSADVTGGKGPGGNLLSTANGGFTTPIFSGGASTTYRLAFAGATGIMLQPGQRLTFRMYFSCGSTATSTRFGLLKNVIVKGESLLATSTRAAAAILLQLYPNPTTTQSLLVHPAAARDARVTVYSALGQVVATVPCAAGTQQTLLNLERLAAGHYLVRYSSGSQQASLHLSKN